VGSKEPGQFKDVGLGILHVLQHLIGEEHLGRSVPQRDLALGGHLNLGSRAGKIHTRIALDVRREQGPVGSRPRADIQSGAKSPPLNVIAHESLDRPP
jgi:hypothetical protein